MNDQYDEFRKSLEVYQDPKTNQWVASFVSVTPEGKRVPRRITCGTREALIRQVERVIGGMGKG